MPRRNSSSACSSLDQSQGDPREGNLKVSPDDDNEDGSAAIPAPETTSSGAVQQEYLRAVRNHVQPPQPVSLHDEQREKVPRLALQLERESQSIRNQESTVRPDHCSSERKDLVQGDISRRGPEQNDQKFWFGNVVIEVTLKGIKNICYVAKNI